jgi:nucleoside phosphorylase
MMSNINDKRRALQTREDWERVLTAAAHLQEIIPDAVLVGGSAAAVHADHRFSYDDDHVVVNLKDRYDQVLTDLENHAGWVTNRLKPPVMIPGDLDGVETGIRNHSARTS